MNIKQAKAYIKTKIQKGVFAKDLLDNLDDNELIIVAEHTKEREKKLPFLYGRTN